MGGDPADVLGAECGRVSEVVLGLEEGDFARPTRCPPWDVRALLGHMWRDLDRVVTYLAEPTPEAPDTDSVSYWRSYNPVAEGPLISARSYEVAGRFGEVARGFDPGRLLRTRLAAIRLDEFLRTRVVELAVHGLDMSDALGREPWITAGGSAVTREILVGLLGVEPPATLGWDDLTFIETGTGRRPLTPEDRNLLGDRAAGFPLLA